MRVKRRSSTTPSSNFWAAGLRSDSSSMTSVPLPARSKAPACISPFSSRPSSCSSTFPSVSDAAVTLIKGSSARRLSACRYLANAPRPVPGSPLRSTDSSYPAYCCTFSRSACITALRPTGASNDGSRVRAADDRLPAASSAASTVRRSLARDSGFSTKSNAPSRVASTAVSTVPCPDMITTGQARSPSSDHSRNSVMPSVSGIQMSSRIRSNFSAARAALASPASPAEVTL